MENIYINNAGLVILWPYLETLFDRLQLTGDEGFRNEAAHQRAGILLHYLATGSSTFNEYELVLNKVMLGISESKTIANQIEITDVEKETMTSLLNAVIQHWNALGSTSIEGLRETFLIREGILTESEVGYHLRVSRKEVDVLLNSIPWVVSTVQLGWMKKPLLVDWE